MARSAHSSRLSQLGIAPRGRPSLPRTRGHSAPSTASPWAHRPAALSRSPLLHHKLCQGWRFSYSTFPSPSTQLALSNTFDELNREVHNGLLARYWPNYLSSGWTKKQRTSAHLAPPLSSPPVTVTRMVCPWDGRSWSTIILQLNSSSAAYQSDPGWVTCPILAQLLQNDMGERRLSLV